MRVTSLREGSVRIGGSSIEVVSLSVGSWIWRSARVRVGGRRSVTIVIASSVRGVASVSEGRVLRMTITSLRLRLSLIGLRALRLLSTLLLMLTLLMMVSARVGAGGRSVD